MKLLNKIAFLLCLASTVTGYAEVGPPTEEIVITLHFSCPASEQLETFKKNLPDPNATTVSYQEFAKSFTGTMTALIQLVESGNISASDWSVNIEKTSSSKEALN